MTPSGLAGKSALVTGGSRGIGRAIVELFAGEDAAVTFYYRGNAAPASGVVAQLTTEAHDVTGGQVDVTEAAAGRGALVSRPGFLAPALCDVGRFTLDQAFIHESM